MERAEKFLSYCKRYEGTSFVGSNVPMILKNLEKAMQDGCLRQFILNEKPYISAFPYVGNMGARGKDQVAIVIALNLYGAEHSAFAAELNQLLKQLIRGNTKQAKAVMVLMAAQMEFQREEVSLINFVDRELIDEVNRKTNSLKGLNIALWLIVGSTAVMGMPGFAMAGVALLSLACAALFVYSIFFRLLTWVFMPVHKEQIIAASVREVGSCVTALQTEE